MRNSLGYQLKALGRDSLPSGLLVGGHRYRRSAIFKHDFFAATALYDLVSDAHHTPSARNCRTLDSRCPPSPAYDHCRTLASPPAHVVLKISRSIRFMGLPLDSLGVALCRHERAMLWRLRDIEGVPRLLARYGSTGLIYAYMPGRTLDERPELPDDYFPMLQALLDRIHARRVACVDMNKRGNLLIAPDGRPGLLDFQIACYIPPRLLISRRLSDALLNMLQREDRYHLRKHHRRLRPDLMDARQQRESRRVSFWIHLHRLLTRPLTRLRRRLLGYLSRSGQLVNDTTVTHPETDPARWQR